MICSAYVLLAEPVGHNEPPSVVFGDSINVRRPRSGDRRPSPCCSNVSNRKVSPTDIRMHASLTVTCRTMPLASMIKIAFRAKPSSSSSPRDLLGEVGQQRYTTDSPPPRSRSATCPGEVRDVRVRGHCHNCRVQAAELHELTAREKSSG